MLNDDELEQQILGIGREIIKLNQEMKIREQTESLPVKLDLKKTAEVIRLREKQSKLINELTQRYIARRSGSGK